MNNARSHRLAHVLRSREREKKGSSPLVHSILGQRNSLVNDKSTIQPFKRGWKPTQNAWVQIDDARSVSDIRRELVPGKVRAMIAVWCGARRCVDEKLNEKEGEQKNVHPETTPIERHDQKRKNIETNEKRQSLSTQPSAYSLFTLSMARKATGKSCLIARRKRKHVEANGRHG